MFGRLCNSLWIALLWLVRTVRAWFGPAEGAVVGRVNLAELCRVLVLALSSGTFLGAIQLIFANLTHFLTIDPGMAGAISGAVTVIVALVEYIRRRKQDDRLRGGIPGV